MSSRPANNIVFLEFNIDDVADIAADNDVDIELATSRAMKWRGEIERNATSLIWDKLEKVILGDDLGDTRGMR